MHRDFPLILAANRDEVVRKTNRARLVLERLSVHLCGPGP